MSSSIRFIMSAARLFSPFSRVFSSSTRTTLQYDQTLTAPKGLGYYRYLTIYSRLIRENNFTKRNFSANSVQPGAPMPSPPPPSSSPLSWIIGIFITVVLPLVANTWSTLLKYKVEVDVAVEAIEEIVEVVAEVADAVDKAAEGISHDLPEGGKLKKLVEFVENAAEETSKDAHILDDAIDKIQEVEDKLEDVIETLGVVEDKQAKM